MDPRDLAPGDYMLFEESNDRLSRHFQIDLGPGGSKRDLCSANVRRQGGSEAANVPTAVERRCSGNGLRCSPTTISQPGDRYEQEADRVAERLRKPEDSSVPSSVFDKRTSSISEPVLKQPAEGEEEEKPADQAPGSSSGVQLRPAGHEVLRSPGQPLTPPHGSSRSHGPRLLKCAHRIAGCCVRQRCSSASYTVGRHIVFGADGFRPETESGRSLLAHELTRPSRGRPPSRVLISRRRSFGFLVPGQNRRPAAATGPP
jgi:hypothetical protein